MRRLISHDMLVWPRKLSLKERWNRFNHNFEEIIGYLHERLVRERRVGLEKKKVSEANWIGHTKSQHRSLGWTASLCAVQFSKSTTDSNELALDKCTAGCTGQWNIFALIKSHLSIIPYFCLIFFELQYTISNAHGPRISQLGKKHGLKTKHKTPWQLEQ